MKIKKGDKVVVVAGKDKGTTGKIERVLPNARQVVISGVNVKKIHQRSRSRREKGQILERAYPIDVSNVMLADPKTSQPTRVGYQFDDQGQKVRIAKKSGQKVGN